MEFQGTREMGQDKYGYNEYPHNVKPFYIQLDYEDVIKCNTWIGTIF